MTIKRQAQHSESAAPFLRISQCFITVLAALVCLAALPRISDAATSWYALGTSHTVVLTEEGTVWTLGENDFGQLGQGVVDAHNHEPQQVPGLNRVKAVAAAGNHSAALRRDGTVWVWGDNISGQLGNDDMMLSATPLPVKGLRGVIAIAAGGSHILALKRDGTVWAWGNNNYGQLGTASFISTPDPVRVKGLDGVTSIAAGAYHCLALKQDGSVWSWGYNAYGELGNPAVSSKGSAVPVQVAGIRSATSVSAGVNHSVAMQGNNTVWVWGSNYYSQIGNGTTGYGSRTPVQVRIGEQVADITARAHHTIALLKDGTALAWGDRGTQRWGNGLEMAGSAVPVRMEGYTGPIAIAALVNPVTIGQTSMMAWLNEQRSEQTAVADASDYATYTVAFAQPE